MWSLSLRIFWLALVVKLVLMIQTIESFISPPTDMVLFGRLMHLKSMGKGNAKIASLMNSDNNIKQASKIRSAETECENPSESELKRQLALGYLKHIEKATLVLFNLLIFNFFVIDKNHKRRFF